MTTEVAFYTMSYDEVIQRIRCGEDSKTQFKKNIFSPEQLAQEIVAFANCEGGFLFVGVGDHSGIHGLTGEDIRRLNQILSNVSTSHVKPPLNTITEIIEIEGCKILLIKVPKGLNKPYCTNKGIYLTKSGSDNRRISHEELQRLFQDSQRFYADEKAIPGTSISHIDERLFERVYERIYNETVEETGISKERLLQNLNLLSGDNLTLAGLLLFGHRPQARRPLFMIKGVSFFGHDIGGTLYRDTEEIRGTLVEQFQGGMSFLLRNLKKTQVEESFNSEGQLELPKIVLEELLVNALVHRNYFIDSPIRIFLFDDRLEIISPGKLHNNLTTEKIRFGLSISRNPILSTFSSKLLPYRGLGTGIVRVFKTYPHILLHNDADLDQFTVVVNRIHQD